MGFDYPADTYSKLARFFNVEINVALRVNDSGLAAIVDEVGRVSETTEIETLDFHGISVPEA
jgi:hypothetical protein